MAGLNIPQKSRDGVERECTIRELAQEMGITVQAVNQIEKRAIKKLKCTELGRKLWKAYGQ